LLADSGFYNERVIIRRARDIAPTVVHVPKKGERMKDKLETHKSYMTTYRMYKDSERELRFPLAVANLLPERRSRQARRGRSWLRGVWRY